MLDGLAFLLVDQVEDGLRHVRDNMPDVAGLDDLLAYFDETYVRGTYPPPAWNVHDATISGTERTNNACEDWNNGLATLLGHQYPSVFQLVGVLQQDAALAETAMIQDARGRAPAKRQQPAAQLHQRRLRQLCCDVRDGRMIVSETLHELGHCIRLC